MTKSIQNPYNRREFLVASGIVVAGGLASCSEREPKHVVSTPKNKQQPLLATPSPTIRVRIGRVRDKSKTIFGNFSISLIGSEWKTNARNTLTPENTMHLHVAKQTQIKIHNKTKQISNDLTFVPRTDISSTAYDVVAHVPIEQYIPGVLAGELFAHWHQATFQAQAVAARSYATSLHLERINKSHFDLNDGPSSQMYLGDVVLESAHYATKETSGMVMSWNGKIIPAYYCACCGGISATATDAISTSSAHNIVPLQGRSGRDVCSKLDARVWSATRPSRTVRKRINACANKMNTPEFSSIRTISSIEPTEFNIHGRPTKLSIYDRNNSPTEVLAKNLFRALNTNVLQLPIPTPTIWSSYLVATKKNSNILFNGAGMGHGVGLCQYGAQELAGKGESWESILQWYYPSVQITTLS
ncbi:MAG: SpoIID/LytB domain-containing protein [Phycisphaerae bacterium]|nr:SpoIID/LytB domain-containing protein [Phycisphaerae bacterium]